MIREMKDKGLLFFTLIPPLLPHISQTEAMEWSGQSDYQKASMEPWYTPDGWERGSFKTSGRLSYLKVFESGHMVPKDQPQAGLEILNQLISNGTLIQLASKNGTESETAPAELLDLEKLDLEPLTEI
ncbi:unnamed protein product [Chrysoparadoxa australica]